MEKNILADKTALPPSMLLGALPMLRPFMLWALQWFGPNQSLQNLRHFRYYASSMGRFLKPDNIITNAANPQSWNLYSYVNNTPINFNDPTGHYGNFPGSTSPTYFSNFSSASWMNWGAYTSFYGGLYGGNIAFGGGGGAGMGSSQSGYWTNVTTYEEQTTEMWLQVNEEGYYTLYGQQYFIGRQYDWAVYPMNELIVSSSLQWVAYGGENQGTTMSAQPMQQTYMSAMPPSRFHDVAPAYFEEV